MTALLRHPKALLCLILLGLALEGRALADDRNMNCDSSAPSTHAQLAAGDQNTASHLELSRKMDSGAAVTLDVCAADLTVRGGGDGQLHVVVDLDNPAAQHAAGDFLQLLEVSSSKAELKLHLPKSVRARVEIVLPKETAQLDVNLVRGGLTFEGDRIGGAREINVVDGHVDFEGDAGTYGNLELNVVMGSYHDYRERKDGHGVLLSRSFSGTGKGSVEINVVKGSVDLRVLE